MASIAGVAAQDHYVVLGVAQDATLADIKRAFRALSLKHHPDTGDGDRGAFDAVQAAYEVLGNEELRTSYDASRGTFTSFASYGHTTSRSERTTTITEEVIYDVPIKVETDSWWGAGRTAIVTLHQLKMLMTVFGDNVFDERYFSRVRVLEEDTELFTTAAWNVRYGLNQWEEEEKRRETLKSYSERFAACQKRIDAMSRMVRDTEKLDRTASKIQYEMEHQGPLYTWRRFDPSKLAGVLNELEHKLEWLVTERNVSALAIELAAGRLKVPGIEFNRSVIEQLQTLQIRSNGLIEAPDEDAMFRFYRDRLQGDDGRQSIAPAEVYSLDLVLHFEDYAPADILEEIKSELLPVVMTIEGKQYPLEYRYIKGIKGREDEWVASGVIEVPLSLYRRLAPAYGKASGFPDMPGGVSRFLRIMKQGEYFTAGFDSLELAAKVEKMEKGRKRLADAPSIEGPTAPPPWYQGRGRAGKRR